MHRIENFTIVGARLPLFSVRHRRRLLSMSDVRVWSRRTVQLEGALIERTGSEGIASSKALRDGERELGPVRRWMKTWWGRRRT